MKFKVGDVVLVSSLPIDYGKIGTVTAHCPVADCVIVKLRNGHKRHFFTHFLSYAKNQQLLFSFMQQS